MIWTIILVLLALGIGYVAGHSAGWSEGYREGRGLNNR